MPILNTKRFFGLFAIGIRKSAIGIYAARSSIGQDTGPSHRGERFNSATGYFECRLAIADLRPDKQFASFGIGKSAIGNSDGIQVLTAAYLALTRLVRVRVPRIPL